jgi:hypothetical protein
LLEDEADPDSETSSNPLASRAEASTKAATVQGSLLAHHHREARETRRLHRAGKEATGENKVGGPSPGQWNGGAGAELLARNKLERKP